MIDLARYSLLCDYTWHDRIWQLEIQEILNGIVKEKNLKEREFFAKNRKLWRFIHNPIIYKYNVEDGNHPIQEVDIKEENSPSVFSSAESLQGEYNRIRLRKRG